MRQLLIIFIALSYFTACTEPPRHGEFSQQDGGRVWDDTQGSWVSPEVFWQNYVQTRTEFKYWGRTRDYPPYGEVKEHDTILIELDSGVCLMEFFHSRWRRANDVRRWDPAFSDYSACADVFDE